MAFEVTMPQMGADMTEGTIVKWFKNVGDAVTRGDIIAEIETDKATMEVEAVDEGTVGSILIAEGTDKVKVNTPIAGSYATRRGGRELLLVVPPDLRRTVVHAARLGSAFTTFPTVPRALSAATAGAGSRGGPARR